MITNYRITQNYALEYYGIKYVYLRNNIILCINVY